MRFAICCALTLLALLPARVASAGQSGEQTCRQYGAKIPMDCACAGPVLEREFNENDMVMVVRFFNNANDPNANFDNLLAMEKEFGKEKLDDLGKRFEGLAVGDLKACLKP
jgi:hypothetical protein